MKATITNVWNRRAILSGRGITGAAFVAMLALSGAARADEAGPAPQAQIGNPGRAAIEQKLKTIIIPEVKFEDTAFVEAVDFLHSASQEQDRSSNGEKGVSFWVQGYHGVEYPRVSMRLKDVSLGDALAKLNALSNTTLKIGATNVAIVPKDAVSNEPLPEVIEAGKRTVIPLVDVEDKPLDEVVKFLNEKSAEKNGPKVTIADGLDPKTKVGAVRLRNTTLVEAVYFVAKEIQCSFAAADGTIRIVAR